MTQPHPRSARCRLPGSASLKVRIACGYGGMVLAMSAALVTVMMSGLHDRLERVLAADQLTLTQTLALELGEKIALQITAVDRVAALVTDGMVEGAKAGDAAALEAFLANRTGILSFFTGGLAVTAADGRVLARSAGFQPGLPAAALQALTAETFATGKTLLTEPYRPSAPATPACAMVVPVRGGDGRVIAVLLGVIRVEQHNFLGRVIDYRIGTGGGIFIYAPAIGQIVVASGRAEVLVPAPRAVPLLDRFAAGYQGSEPATGPDGAIELISGHPIPYTRWILVTRVPLGEAFRPITEIVSWIIDAVILFTALSLAGLWMVLVVAFRPLARATATIEAMADGRLPFQPLTDIGANEIGGLLSAFNALHARIAASEQALKASHHELKAREGLYYELFENSKAVEILIDPTSGQIIDANIAATRYYGWSKDTLKGMRIDQINTLSPEAILDEMRQAKAERRSQFFFRHRLASGEVRDVEVHSGPFVIEGRQLLYSVVHDISDRRQAERETRQLLSFQRALLDAAGIAIITTNVDGTITLFNSTAERWLGYRAAEVVGRATPVLFLDPEEIARRARQAATGDAPAGRPDLSGFQVLCAGALAGGAPVVSEWTLLGRSRTRLPVLLSISAIPDAEGRAGGFVAIAQDISSFKALEADLRRSNADLERFAYVASHDLRQPLRMISGYLGLLTKTLKARLGPDEEKYIRFAVDGAQRMDQMIKDLLDYSRIGRISGAPEPVSLDDSLARALDTLAGPIAETGASVSVPSPLPAIEGNPSELERLFQNLVSNALKFRHPERPPEVTIRAEEQEGEWRIAVTDNGIGIDPEQHDRLFKIFQRLVSREQYEGNGIGLAACRKIMDHHGGRIWVESGLDAGCTFWIALPRQPGPAATDGEQP